MREPMRYGHDLQSISAIGSAGAGSRPFIWVVVIIFAISIFRAIPGDFKHHIEQWQQKEDLEILDYEVEESPKHYIIYIKLRNNGPDASGGMPSKIKTNTGYPLREQEYSRVNVFRSIASGLPLEPVGIPARADGMVVISIAKNSVTGAESITIHYDTLDKQRIKIDLSEVS